MILLPNNLACVANFADKKESGARWAVTGIHVEALPDNRYAVAATDTKQLIVVEGVCPGQPEDYPKNDTLANARNGATKALIPAKDFGEIMKESAKNTKSEHRPILKTVALQMADAVPEKLKQVKRTVEDEDGEHEQPVRTEVEVPAIPGQVVMGWTNMAKSNTPTVTTCDGRFPPFRDIIPKKSPLCRIPLDPQYVINIADAMKNLKPMMDKDNCRVEMDFYGENRPVIFRYENGETNQKTMVLIMPLCTDRNQSCYDGFDMPAGLMDEDYWKSQAEQFQAKADECEARNDKLHDEIQKLKDEVKTLKKGGAITQEEADAIRKQQADCEKECKRLEDLLHRQSLELSAREHDLAELRSNLAAV